MHRLSSKFRRLPRAGLLVGAVAAALWVGGCSTTTEIPAGRHLLRSATVKLDADKSTPNKGVLVDALDNAVLQKPNNRFLGLFPVKLWLYNGRRKRAVVDSTKPPSRSVEAPVFIDSALTRRSASNMTALLYSQGYYYAQVRDTTRYDSTKAYVTYNVRTGPRYFVDTVTTEVADASISPFIKTAMEKTLLKRGEPYSQALGDAERARITEAMRNAGFYKFSAENVYLEMDSFRRPPDLAAADPIAGAFAELTSVEEDDRRRDVVLSVRRGEDSTAFFRYAISRITVLPDYRDRTDFRDSTMTVREYDGIRFRYHNYYLREGIIARNILLEPGTYYTQDRYDRTVTQLTDLGVFQYVRVNMLDDTTAQTPSLRVAILLNPTPRYDANTNLEVSTGANYVLGNAVSVGLRNRNLGRGANQLNLTASGGVEFQQRDAAEGQSYAQRFYLRTRNLGFNAALDLPKFVAPINKEKVSRRNLPRTIISAGASALERVEYFTLINFTSQFAYNWHETETTTWDVAPAFVSVLRRPKTSDTFKRLLDTVAFLRNTYRPTFIEGESVARTFANAGLRDKRSNTYLRVGVEEAGGLLGLVDGLTNFSSDRFQFEQYTKLDVDARHYINYNRSSLAFRGLAGIGIPYGRSEHLPYVKQYFVGGAYSIRGWRVRTLGPGAFVDTASETGRNTFIDRTGDIRLEGNAEYRFNIVKLFAGSTALTGAVFADGGNIWLATPDPAFAGGEFRFDKLGADLALSTGFGLRADFGGFITARFDVGIPVKFPRDAVSTPTWIFSRPLPYKTDGTQATWLETYLIPQLAIGYPF